MLMQLTRMKCNVARAFQTAPSIHFQSSKCMSALNITLRLQFAVTLALTHETHAPQDANRGMDAKPVGSAGTAHARSTDGGIPTEYICPITQARTLGGCI